VRWRDSVQRGPLLGAWARRSRSLALDSSYTFRPQLIQYSAGSFAVQKGPIPMTRLEWGILILAGLWALLTNITVRRHYKSSTTPQIPTNTFAMIQLLSVVGISVLHRSPFHLLWLFPLSYIAAFFTLRSRVLAFFPWLYGYILAYTIPSNWFVSEPNGPIRRE